MSHGGTLQGVGSIGQTAVANETDYEAKRQVLAPILQSYRDRGAVTLLDAGAGVGIFCGLANELGFVVDALDFSSAALGVVDTNALGVRRWQSIAIEDFCCAPDERYDVAICIDVMFHIIDNSRWSRALNNLLLALNPNGVLVLQEHLVDAPDAELDALGNKGRWHTRWRTLDDYLAALVELQFVDHVKYCPPNERVSKDVLIFERRFDGLTTISSSA